MIEPKKYGKKKAALNNNIKTVKEYKKAILTYVEKLNSKKRAGLLSREHYESLINNFEGKHYKAWLNHYDECLAYYYSKLEQLEEEKANEGRLLTFYVSCMVIMFWMLVFITRLNIFGFAVFSTSDQTSFNLGTYNLTFFNTTGSYVQLNVSNAYGSYESKIFSGEFAFFTSLKEKTNFKCPP